MDAPDRPTALRRLDFWLDACDRLDLPEFKSCRKTLVNWKPYILNDSRALRPMGLPRVATTQSRHSKESPSGSETSVSFRARILLSLSPYPNI